MRDSPEAPKVSYTRSAQTALAAQLLFRRALEAGASWQGRAGGSSTAAPQVGSTPCVNSASRRRGGRGGMGATQSQGGPVEFPGVADWSQLAGIISIGFDSATGQLKFETGGMAVGAEVRSEVGSLRTYAITARFPRQPAPLVLLLPEAGAESVAPPVQLRVAAERVLEGVHPEDFQRLVGRRGSAGGGGAAARLVWRPVGGLGSTRGWQRIGVVTSLRSCGDNVLLISARLHFKGSLGVAAERQAARRTASHTLHLTLTAELTIELKAGWVPLHRPAGARDLPQVRHLQHGAPAKMGLPLLTISRA